MWKKVLWVYLVFYTLGILAVIIGTSIRDFNDPNFDPVSRSFALLLFLPPGILALALRGKRVSILLTLLGLLIVAIPVAGIFNFNPMDLATIGKALIFLPMIAGLVYFGYKRLFKK